MPETTCTHHPDRPAVDQCLQCGSALCAECRQEVAGNSLCESCVTAMRSRMASEVPTDIPAMAPLAPVGSNAGFGEAIPPVAPVATGGPFAAPASAANGGVATPYVPYVPPAPAVPAAPAHPARMLIGALLGLLVGAICAFVYDKFVFYTHFQWGLINSAIGFAVGLAVVIGAGRGGLVLAILSALIGFWAHLFSFELLINDQLASQGATFRLPLFNPMALVFTATHLEPFDWVFIAIGVYGAFKVPFGMDSSQS